MSKYVLNLPYVEGGVAVPSDFARDDFIFVYADGVPATDFTVEITGAGDRILTVENDPAEICMVYRPGVDLELSKFSPEILQGINDYVSRMAARIELLQRQVDGAFMGGPCDVLPDGDCLIPVVSEGAIVWLSHDEYIELCKPVLPAVVPDEVEPPDEPEFVQVLSKTKPAFIDCDVWYDPPAPFHIDVLVADWPVPIRAHDEFCAASPSIHLKPDGFCIVDFCKRKNFWQGDTITLALATEKPELEFQL